MADIKELRNQIDEIDKEIKSLFLHRMEICRQVGEYKAKRGLPVLDPKREQELLQAKSDGLSEEKAEQVRRLFKTVMDISKDEQRKICDNSGAVGFCGIEGAHAYFAAKTVSDRVRSYGSFEELAEAVESGEIDKGVLPIENTTSGSVLEVYDILGKGSVYIVGEIVMPISHSLLGVGGIEDVKTVMSHPQALMQCSGFLKRGGYGRIQAVNTAVAAKECKDRGDASVGAIASSSCGQLYGLNVLKEAIEDKAGNKTRFVVIAREKSEDTSADKASITFTLPHRQGSLIEMLDNFKTVNLCKIESRPVGDFEYRFYVDFVADDPRGELAKLTDVYNTVKVLGVYKGHIE